MFFLGAAFELRRPKTWLPASVALATRILTRRPGQPLSEVPAHVAIFWPLEDETDSSVIIGYREVEAVIPAIRQGIIPKRLLPTKRVLGTFEFTDTGGQGWLYAAKQTGKRYGYEAAALTGLHGLPAWRSLVGRVWPLLAAGRTVPADCSILASEVLKAASAPFPPPTPWPLSPNELMIFMEEK